MLTDTQVARLSPLIRRIGTKRGVGPRQRLIIALVADGYSPLELSRWTVRDLMDAPLHPEYAASRDHVISLLPDADGLAFRYPNGSPTRLADYYRTIRDAMIRGTGTPGGLDELRAYVTLDPT